MKNNIEVVNYGQFEVEPDITYYDLMQVIKLKNQNRVVAVKINDAVKDLKTKVNDKDNIEYIFFDSELGKSIYWHSTAHIMAQAVKRLFKDVKLAIGPSISEGFYYDFETTEPFTPEDIEQIEKEMEKISREDIEISRYVLHRDETEKKFQTNEDKYKLELIRDFEDDSFSFYKQGEFEDLCRGPHIPSTGIVKNFKLLSIAGAYWRGDERREMLQRIYGISFPSNKELKQFLRIREEAKKRDHRKLGKQLGLFEFFPEAPGMPFFKPKGTILWNNIIEYWREIHKRNGYEEIMTPMILNEDLWHQSGHWDNYKNNMYFTEIDDKMNAVKPMNCPGGLLLYRSSLHSYREFPIKTAELGRVHRHEKSGVLHGLFRVRTFVVDDAHIFCLNEQIKDEVISVINMIIEIFKVFGFEKYSIELSTRPEKSIGSDEMWEKATSGLKNALDSTDIPYEIQKGEGAFYGPKIDFHIEDCLKRTWQCGTIQLDFSMPEKFELEYVGGDNQKHRPVMIHRAIFGSVERFMGMLIEQYAGAFPVWLTPVQVRIIPVSDNFIKYSEEVLEKLEKNQIRAEIDYSNESLGKKIRNAQVEKIPYALVLGQKEQEASTVNYRKYGEKKQSEINVDEFISNILSEIKEKK